MAELVACGAGGWDTVARHMTLHHYASLRRYWQRYPPTHLLLAGWLGIGRDVAQKPADLGQLLALFGDGRIH